MGSVELDQSWLVSFRPFLLKAALANNHHHVMAQLLDEGGACYCQALEKLEAQLLGEQEEQLVLWQLMMPVSPFRQWPSPQERGMD